MSLHDQLREIALKSRFGVSKRFMQCLSEHLVRSGHFVQLRERANQQLLKQDAAKTLSDDEFAELLRRLDSSFQPPAATAQMANKAGRYLGSALNRLARGASEQALQPFAPVNDGGLCYLGKGRAIVNLRAPALLAASVYMELGRIVMMLKAEEQLLWIRRSWMTKIFVGGDVFSFLLQAAGAWLAGMLDMSFLLLVPVSWYMFADLSLSL